MAGKVNPQNIPVEDQFHVVDDEKLRMSVAVLADRYDIGVRNMIYRAYNDADLMMMYKNIRNSGVYEKGGKGGARHRKIVIIPNGYISDFLDAVMIPLYGPDWLKNNRALQHELVRPWWVVNKL